jgi:hypothetical protein
MQGRKPFLAVAIVAAAVSALAGCAASPAAPTAVPSQPPGCSVTVTVNGDGSVNVNGCGNTTITPSPSPSAPASGGDNTFAGFAIFCYGFGTQPGQTEPNHDACQLPVGYPDIAVTASPKNAKGIDLPSPGDKTDPKVIDWDFTVVPATAASLVVQPDNRFNARVLPADPRVAGAAFTLTAHYTDPQGVAHEATKVGGIK